MRGKRSIASRRSFADAQDDGKGAFLLVILNEVAEVKDQREAIFMFISLHQ
jgi:hypothetical protein